MNALRCFGSQPWSCCWCSVNPLVALFAMAFTAGAFSSKLPKEDSRKLKTHTWHAHTGGSDASAMGLFLFSMSLKGRKERENKVCVCVHVCDPKPDFKAKPTLSVKTTHGHTQTSTISPTVLSQRQKLTVKCCQLTKAYLLWHLWQSWNTFFF